MYSTKPQFVCGWRLTMCKNIANRWTKIEINVDVDDRKQRHVVVWMSIEQALHGMWSNRYIYRPWLAFPLKGDNIYNQYPVSTCPCNASFNSFCSKSNREKTIVNMTEDDVWWACTPRTLMSMCHHHLNSEFRNFHRVCMPIGNRYGGETTVYLR